MNLQFDLRDPIQQPNASFEPSRLWIPGLAAVDRSPVAQPAMRPYSFLSECACPDDCLRDHENE